MNHLTQQDLTLFEITEALAHKRMCEALEGAARDVVLGGIPASDFKRQLLRVLIVDDHHDTADTFAALARFWGHDVRRAYDGATGLSLAAAFSPNVLLLDMLMSEMSGFEVARQIRRKDRFDDCFLVAITGRTDESHRCQSYESGIDLCLIKPVVPAHLETLLRLESEHIALRHNGARQLATSLRQRSDLVCTAMTSGVILHET